MHEKLRRVTAEEFYVAIKQAMAGDSRECFLSDYSQVDYEMMVTVLMYNDQAGFALEGDNLANIFSSRQNPVKQSLDIMMPSVLSFGVTKLDCFGEDLCRKYAKYGFAAVTVTRFLDEYAPRNWDYGKFGRPAVYFMAQAQKLPKGSLNNVTESVPYLSYDEAWAYRERLLGGI